VKRSQASRPDKPARGRKESPPPGGPPARSGGPQDLTGSQRHYIGQLVELLQQHNLTELELEREGLRVRLRREPSAPAMAPVTWESRPVGQEVQPEPPHLPGPDTKGAVTVTSPIVGTFYRSPSPDADPYVEEGDIVKKGQVLCIVEAMKLMNEIESEVEGRVVKILAESTKPVEYGQPLFLIAPASAS
jgi:acetyl-CoA carboxylase biotin carboxyl carrier protein